MRSNMNSNATTLAAAALLLLAPGCGGADPGAGGPYDAAEARTTLVSALDAWKKGEAKALAKRTPPIRFIDDDQIAGYRLSGYRIGDGAAPAGPHQRVAVSLDLLDPRGRPAHREVGYQVAVGPAPAVLRDDP